MSEDEEIGSQQFSLERFTTACQNLKQRGTPFDFMRFALAGRWSEGHTEFEAFVNPLQGK